MTHEEGGDKGASIDEPSDLDLDLDEDILAAPNGLLEVCFCYV